MNGPRDYHTKRNKSEKDKYDITYMQTLQKNNTNECIYESERDTQTQKTDLQLAKGKRQGG